MGFKANLRQATKDRNYVPHPQTNDEPLFFAVPCSEPASAAAFASASTETSTLPYFAAMAAARVVLPAPGGPRMRTRGDSLGSSSPPPPPRPPSPASDFFRLRPVILFRVSWDICRASGTRVRSG